MSAILHLYRRPFLTALLIAVHVLLFYGDLFGQSTRISAGYTLRNFSAETVINPDVSSESALLQKGSIHVEVEQLFRHSFFMGIRSDYLIHNRNTPLTGGPVDFNQVSFKGSVGLQWDRIGLYTGVNGGYLWDLSFQPSENAQTGLTSITPSGESGSFFGGLHIGARYYLFRYLRVEAEFRNPVFAKNRFEPNSARSSLSGLSSIRFEPTQFSVGVSVSIPIRNRARARSSSTRTGSTPPPLLSTSGSVRFRSPVDGPALITSPFGRRWGRMHEGVDIDARKGDRILAAADGVVVEAKTSVSYGRMVIVQHSDLYSTYYTHLSRISVSGGDRVRAGDVIGQAGDTGVATGVHLHFEVRRNGVAVDPERYIRF
ncbi:M23 family metallopeptidase [Rhodohalobacter mucosus]|uniref:M23ase beta-sheet core domain-containing protein n=1 Tax=Rhodohalobacter mucosus TaxID=2079485 RepID=A0A316TRP5_9BACT|nr:M23 family metallopeptidase [Rhodohalobacter mucosus]PWN07247.1 hypothetical protein DDZ15_05455 [Rhodohalobacter mucosus]